MARDAKKIANNALENIKAYLSDSADQAQKKGYEVKKYIKNNYPAENIKAYLSDSADQPQKKGYEVKNYIKKSYPALVHSFRDFAQETAGQTKGLLTTAGGYAGGAANAMGAQLRYTERKLIKIGFLYTIYRLFAKDTTTVVNAKNDIKNYIQQKPIESAFIAFGTGYILGKLFR